MAKSNKKLGLYSSLSNIPDMIVQDEIEYYRIYAKKETKDEVKYIEYMNTKYYSDIPLTYIDETTGIVYYVNKPEKPEGNYKLVEIIPEGEVYGGQTYYAWVLDEPEPVYPESIEIKGITYYLVKPEKPEGDYILVQVVPPGEEYKGQTYYAWVKESDITPGPQPQYPESVEIDGIVYYLVKPTKPEGNYKLVSIVPEGEEYGGQTYYAWILDEEGGDEPGPQYPESVEIDGIVYYSEQKEKPEGNYKLVSIVPEGEEYGGQTYYAWILDEEGGDEPGPEPSGDLFYIGIEEINENNYRELAQEFPTSESSVQYNAPNADDENPDGYNVYVFMSDSHSILSTSSGIMTVITPKPSTIFEGYKLYTYSVDIYGLNGTSLTIQLS